MKKFNFSLESLLTLRDWEEQNARAVLGQANAQVERIEMRIRELENSITESYASWNGDDGRRFTPMDRMGLASQVAELEKQTQQVRKEKNIAELRRADAMKRLQLASRNKKVVTNLKEKRLEAFNAELLKQEAAEIEDIFNARRRRD